MNVPKDKDIPCDQPLMEEFDDVLVHVPAILILIKRIKNSDKEECRSYLKAINFFLDKTNEDISQIEIIKLLLDKYKDGNKNMLSSVEVILEDLVTSSKIPSIKRYSLCTLIDEIIDDHPNSNAFAKSFEVLCYSLNLPLPVGDLKMMMNNIKIILDSPAETKVYLKAEVAMFLYKHIPNHQKIIHVRKSQADEQLATVTKGDTCIKSLAAVDAKTTSLVDKGEPSSPEKRAIPVLMNGNIPNSDDCENEQLPEDAFATAEQIPVLHETVLSQGVRYSQDKNKSYEREDHFRNNSTDTTCANGNDKTENYKYLSKDARMIPVLTSRISFNTNPQKSNPSRKQSRSSSEGETIPVVIHVRSCADEKKTLDCSNEANNADGNETCIDKGISAVSTKVKGGRHVKFKLSESDKYLFLRKKSKPRKVDVRNKSAIKKIVQARKKKVGEVSKDETVEPNVCKTPNLQMISPLEKKVKDIDMTNTGDPCWHCGQTCHISNSCPLKKPTGECWHCGKTGHVHANCPYENGKSVEEVKCWHCNGTGHFARNCPDKQDSVNNECLQCGEKGHVHVNCPRVPGKKGEEVKCWQCDGTGHFARNCPDKPDTIDRGYDKTNSKSHDEERSPTNETNIRNVEGKTKCWHCKTTGHFPRNCPKVDKECWRCGEKGHIQFGCTKQRNCDKTNNGADKPNIMPDMVEEGNNKIKSRDHERNTTKNMKRRNSFNSNEENKECWICGEKGHIQFDCTKQRNCDKTNNGADKPNIMPDMVEEGNNKIKSRDHERNTTKNMKRRNSFNSNEENKECWICGEKGHIQFECPKRKKKSSEGFKCRNCQIKGHKAYECPNEHKETVTNDNQKQKCTQKAIEDECWRCGEIGHKKFACPKFQTNPSVSGTEIKKCIAKCQSISQIVSSGLVKRNLSLEDKTRTLYERENQLPLNDESNIRVDATGQESGHLNNNLHKVCYLCGEMGHIQFNCSKNKEI